MFNIRIGLTRESQARIDRFPEMFREALEPTFEKIILRAEGKSKQDYFLNSGGPDPRKLTARSGNLRRSISHTVREQADKIFASLVSGVEYAATHEFGDGSRNISIRSYLYPAIQDVIEDDSTEQFLINELDRLTRWR